MAVSWKHENRFLIIGCSNLFGHFLKQFVNMENQNLFCDLLARYLPEKLNS